MLTTRTWHSIHVYLHRSDAAVDAFLIDGVAPTLDRLVRDRRAGGWFFIRYWAGGPHIRVRLREAGESAVDDVERTLRILVGDLGGARETLDAETYYAALLPPGGGSAEQHGWHADGSIIRIAYEPEVDRYGGPTGLVHSEDFFERSTQAALVALRIGRDRPAKLRLAFDAVVASVGALEIPPLEIPVWLRQHVAAWTFSPEAPLLPAPALRAQAEREFFEKRDRYRARALEITRATAPDAPRSFAAAWNREMRALVARYRAAATAGLLARPPLEIVKSQLHMFLNRLGLSMADEFYVCWLASLALSSLHAPGFFEDGPAALDRQYHEHSKYTAAVLAAQRPDRSKLLPRRVIFTSRQEVGLPPPLAAPPLQPLAMVLMERRTARELAHPLSAQELSSLLYYSAATVGTRRLEIPETPAAPARTIETIHRTYPSAGAKYPVRLMLLVQHVDGVPPGLYLYLQDQHTLARVGDVPPPDTLHALSPLVDPEGIGTLEARDIPVWLFAVADFEHLRQVYGLRAYRFIAIECGHLGQNVSLTATALNLASAMLGGYYDDAVNQMLCIDGVQLSTMYVMLVGKGRP